MENFIKGECGGPELPQSFWDSINPQKKRGFIKCSDALIKQDWKYLYVFFKDFRPTHIEFRHWENDIWYFYGVSEKFETVKEGECVPQYDVVFTKQENGELLYEFNKVV